MMAQTSAAEIGVGGGNNISSFGLKGEWVPLTRGVIRRVVLQITRSSSHKEAERTERARTDLPIRRRSWRNATNDSANTSNNGLSSRGSLESSRQRRKTNTLPTTDSRNRSPTSSNAKSGIC